MVHRSHTCGLLKALLCYIVPVLWFWLSARAGIKDSKRRTNSKGLLRLQHACLLLILRSYVQLRVQSQWLLQHIPVRMAFEGTVYRVFKAIPNASSFPILKLDRFSSGIFTKYVWMQNSAIHLLDILQHLEYTAAMYHVDLCAVRRGLPGFCQSM